MKKYLFFLIFFFLSNNSYSSSNIVYINMDFLLNNSEVGKSINQQIKILNDDNNEFFKATEKKLREEEEKIIKQKNILNQGDFEKKINELKKKINLYNNKKNIKMNEINKIKVENTKKIYNFIKPLITEYSQKNNILMIIEKKNIVIGKKSLDITNDIIQLLNAKVKTLNINQ